MTKLQTSEPHESNVTAFYRKHLQPENNHIYLLHYVNKIWIHKKAHWQSVSLVGNIDINMYGAHFNLLPVWPSKCFLKAPLWLNSSEIKTQLSQEGGKLGGSQILTRYVLSFIIISPSTLSRLQHLRKIDDARCCPLFHTFRALGSVSNMDLLRLFTFHSPHVCHHVHMLWICALPHLRICLVIGHLASGPLTRH